MSSRTSGVVTNANPFSNFVTRLTGGVATGNAKLAASAFKAGLFNTSPVAERIVNGGTPKTVSKGSTKKQSSGGDTFSMSPEPEFAYYVQQIMDMYGLSFEEAAAVASSGGGGYGGGGGGSYGGGGNGAAIAALAAARDQALANSASTYGSAAATFDGSHDKYREIHKTETGTTSGATADAVSGAQAAFAAGNDTRAAERAALGIEDARYATTDALKKAADTAVAEAKDNGARMEARAQGHLDNNLDFNTKLKSVVELEGKEKQKEITDYYQAQLAQSAAKVSSGGSSGGRRSSGSRSSSGSNYANGFRKPTIYQINSMARELQDDDLRRRHAMYQPSYNQKMLQTAIGMFPNASLSAQTSAAKFIGGGTSSQFRN